MDPAMDRAFRLIPYGIYVLAVRHGETRRAMIVSWVSQVSYDPPLLMVALRRNRPALPILRESGAFTLSLLGADRKSLVSLVKGSPVDSQLESGGILKDALASWECRLSFAADTGDHVLCVGEVLRASAGQEGRPLTTEEYGKSYIGQG